MLRQQDGMLERAVEFSPLVRLPQADGALPVTHLHETIYQTVDDVAALHERPLRLVDADKCLRVVVNHPCGNAEDDDDNGVADGYLDGNTGFEHGLKLSANVRQKDETSKFSINKASLQSLATRLRILKINLYPIC